MKRRCLILIFFIVICGMAAPHEIYFFSEGTDLNYYDQGIVDVINMGESSFEYTFPPDAPQYNDKVPCSSLAYKGSSSLKFNYKSAEKGNWRVTIFRNDWSEANISEMDTLSFFIYSQQELPASALPYLGLRALDKNGTGEVVSKLYQLEKYNNEILAGQWTEVKIPLTVMFQDPENENLDFNRVKAIVFNQSEKNETERLIFIDEILAFNDIVEIPIVQNFIAKGYDSHTELSWKKTEESLPVRVYASYDNGQSFEKKIETKDDYFFDFVLGDAKNNTIKYKAVSVYRERESEPVIQSATLKDFSDDELLDMMQEYTFRYFYEGAHQVSGLALERTDGDGITVASGATGMGLMAMIIASERGFETKEQIKQRVFLILNSLDRCERHHGAWSHWYNGETLRTKPFTPDDDGGDIVETSFVAQGLIAIRNYFIENDEISIQIRQLASRLWREIEWNWYRNGEQNVLYWHWSPNIGFQKNMMVTGWNESMGTYIMAASSPTYGIDKVVYEQGWARNGAIVNERTFYNYKIKLSPDWGGPMFWIHYSFLGINPNGLSDKYADYWIENVNTAKIHHAYAVNNPMGYENYSEKNWGLTASDDPDGYSVHQPVDNDNGTISPTAALASIPYTPNESIKALKYFYRERGAELFGKYGPYDAFNDTKDWIKNAYIGIDQGPIVVMIENYRTNLIWNLVMNDDEVKEGLDKLDFKYETSTGILSINKIEKLNIYPNPVKNRVFINIPNLDGREPLLVRVYSVEGKKVVYKELVPGKSEYSFDCSNLRNGYYLMLLQSGEKKYRSTMIINK